MDLTGAAPDNHVTVFADGTGLLRVSFEGCGIIHGHRLEMLCYFCHSFLFRKGGCSAKGDTFLSVSKKVSIATVNN